MTGIVMCAHVCVISGTLQPRGCWLVMKYAMKRIGSELQRRASTEPQPVMDGRIAAALARLAEMEQKALRTSTNDNDRLRVVGGECKSQ
jgi:hypothetical protein